MTEVKQMYKIARYIDSNEYQNKRPKLTEVLDAIKDCSNRYADKKPWRNHRRCAGWLENALAHRFVKVEGTPERGHYLKVEHGKGMQLVSKKWGIFRTGLREITMKEYPNTQAMYKTKFIAVVGAIATVVGAIAGSIATYALTHHN